MSRGRSNSGRSVGGESLPTLASSTSKVPWELRERRVRQPADPPPRMYRRYSLLNGDVGKQGAAALPVLAARHGQQVFIGQLAICGGHGWGFCGVSPTTQASFRDSVKRSLFLRGLPQTAIMRPLKQDQTGIELVDFPPQIFTSEIESNAVDFRQLSRLEFMLWAQHVLGG